MYSYLEFNNDLKNIECVILFVTFIIKTKV
ncbi:hypothetical protein J3D55_003343 [Chryseobacterium ginsenosidimutans]|nr:hypothetical protein [Chryseobacterium ginsenosidimutans]